MRDLAAHPFSPAHVAYESGASDKSERAWLAFVAECERLLGHSLDGNDPDSTGDGYSLDEASAMFDRGVSAHAYVVTVGSRERYQPRRS